MNLDHAFISRMLQDQNIELILNKKVTSELFHGESVRVFTYVMDFWRTHSEFPSRELIEEKFRAFAFREVSEPLTFWVEELQKRHIHNLITSAMPEIGEALKAKEPGSALDLVRQIVIAADADIRRVDDGNMTLTTASRLTRLHKMRELFRETGSLVVGVASPWKSLDDETLGWQSEQFIVITGRPNVGKTWGLVILACFAWLAGERVLFISNEMSQQEIEKRVDAFLTKIPYRQLRTATMSEEVMASYMTFLDDMKKAQDFWISGEQSSVSAIDAKIEQYKPTVIFIDGVYLMPDELGGNKAWERVGNIGRGLKQVAKKRGLPILGSSQLNRGASKKFEGVDLDNLAFTDQLAMDADIILAMLQDEDMRLDREMRWQLVKLREGNKIKFLSEWDFDTMNFDEREAERTTVDDIEHDEGDLPF